MALIPGGVAGSVTAELENPVALSQPISVKGDWHQWQVSPELSFCGTTIVGSGAPLNTVQPSGQMLLSWQPLLVTLQNGNIGMTGTMKLEMTDMGSRLSSVKPLGSYDLILDWRGTQASATLRTVKGPMLLAGSGTLANGRLQSSRHGPGRCRTGTKTGEFPEFARAKPQSRR